VNFTTISYAESHRLTAQHACFLIDDNWDDYTFKTLFQLLFFDQSGRRIEVGHVKIANKGLRSGRVAVPKQFTSLGVEYYSLGQSQEYYETLLLIAEDDRIAILETLRDAVWDKEIYSEFEEEAAFQTSLLRGTSSVSVTKFRDVIRRSAQAVPYEFSYTFPSGQPLLFRVTPDLVPPTNIHVVIGRNGVGKTRLLSAISTLLRSKTDDTGDPGRGTLSFTLAHDEQDAPRFANLIDVAFSVFDDFEPPADGGTSSGIRYSYIGLRRRQDENEPSRPKSLDEFADEFVRSTFTCLRSSRQRYWLSAMEVLEADPIFAAMELSQLDETQSEEELSRLFRRASSGHKIVLLTMTRLVELVSERTLVLIDEPEAHLHPPLAASFIRALSALLASRNGVGILATHSPVMLQEVPQDCVWLLFRSGSNIEAERSQVETFAENLGVLTREVFRLEVTKSGYHTIISKAVETHSTLESLLADFRGHLGAEGRALARVLWREHTE
jgi:predicted ATPase